jgi:hypothetical protein
MHAREKRGRKKAVAGVIELRRRWRWLSPSPPRVVAGPLQLVSSLGVPPSRPSVARRHRGRVPSPVTGALAVRATLSVRSAATALSLSQEKS